jgi:hypothetical protein
MPETPGPEPYKGDLQAIIDMMVEFGYGLVLVVVEDHRVKHIYPGPSIRVGSIDMSTVSRLMQYAARGATSEKKNRNG